MAHRGYYYVHTLAAFTEALGKDVARVEHYAGKPTQEHLAWMVEKIARLDRTSMDDAICAGQMIGKMLLAAEMYKFWNHTRSRELLGADKHAGFDRPYLNRSA